MNDEMSGDVPAMPRGRGVPWTLWGLGVVILLLAGAITLGIHNRTVSRRTLAAQMQQGRQVVVCLRWFSSDNSGNYPLRLEDLVKLGQMEDKTLLDVYVEKGRPTEPWHFYNELNDSGTGDIPLLVSPLIKIRPDFLDQIWFWVSRAPVHPNAPHRIVVMNDSSVAVMSESQFDSLVISKHLEFPPPPAMPEPPGWYGGYREKSKGSEK